MRSFPALLAFVLAAVTIVQAAVRVVPTLSSLTVALTPSLAQPVRKNQDWDTTNEANGKVDDYLSNEVN